MDVLHYRAGARALSHLREHGLSPQDVQAFVLPATGPRWLLCNGFDRALLEHGWLGRHDQLLFGASAGAWRALALAARDPAQTYARLLDGYITQHFTFEDDPRAISRAYAELLENVFSEDDIAHALSHDTLDLALVAARGSALMTRRSLQYLALGSAALFNFATRRAPQWMFERTVFHARAGRANAHRLAMSLAGERCSLTRANAHAVALASGSVPLYMQPVTNISGAARGAYLDGGLSDYHLSQTLRPERGVVLLFMHQAKIVPAWLDQFVIWRKPRISTLEHVLLVYPSPELVRSLPGGVVPSRDDFKTFVNDPETRFSRWRSAVTQTAPLGQAFLDDVRSGALMRRVRAI